MKNIHRLQSAHGKFVAIVFREEMLKLGSELNALIDLTGSLEELVNNGKEKKSLIDGLNEDARQIRRGLEDIEELTEKSDRLESQIEKLKGEIEKLEVEIKSLKKTSKFREYAESEEKIKGIEEKKKLLEKNILNELSPLKKVLRKVIKLSEDGKCELEPYAIAKEYLEHPVETYLSHDKDSKDLDSILATIKECIESGALRLKNKEKTLAKIETISQGGLGGIKREYSGLVSEESFLREKMQSIGPEKSALETRLHEKELELDSVGREIEETRPKINNAEGHIKNLKAEAESKMSELEGGKVVLLIEGLI